MDTLHDQLAALADDAPTGGAPAVELWARGKRAHRLRVAAVAASVLVVLAVGVGVRIVDGHDTRADIGPAGIGGLELPIEYPVAEKLADLSDAPGPLAAVWEVPVGAGAPEVVGLVAATGTFGKLPIELPDDDPQGVNRPGVALSADGRRLAYPSRTGELTVRDLVSGEYERPLSEFASRPGFFWTDATHLIGNVAEGSDADGWVWQAGTAPTRVDYWDYGRAFDLWVSQQGSGPRPDPGEDSCSSPILLDRAGEFGKYAPGWGYTLEVPVLCDVLGIIGSEILLGHWNSDHLLGDWEVPDDLNGTVVALDIHGAAMQFNDPRLRRMVASAGGPERVALASDLIGAALDADGGGS